jgi:hypothetical protein
MDWSGMIRLTKEVKDLSNENYKTPKKKEIYRLGGGSSMRP